MTHNDTPAFISLRVITDDVDRMLGFYERATGLTATRATDDFAELDTRIGRLVVAHARTMANLPSGLEPGTSRSIIIEFLVDDPDAVRDLLGSGADVVLPPTTMPWGNRSFLVRDPDGNLVNFFAPVSREAIAKFRGAAGA
ncbi:MAG TPA: VOC family protein [Pseudolysinimonas sp.]|nr:VOC family protein [Pseudolysinimonas sp.]